jgi:hypothetical protein
VRGDAEGGRLARVARKPPRPAALAQTKKNTTQAMRANIAKYRENCRTYHIVQKLEDGVRIRFVFPNGSSVVAFVTNDEMELL